MLLHVALSSIGLDRESRMQVEKYLQKYRDDVHDAQAEERIDTMNQRGHVLREMLLQLQYLQTVMPALVRLAELIASNPSIFESSDARFDIDSNAGDDDNMMRIVSRIALSLLPKQVTSLRGSNPDAATTTGVKPLIMSSCCHIANNSSNGVLFISIIHHQSIHTRLLYDLLLFSHISNK